MSKGAGLVTVLVVAGCASLRVDTSVVDESRSATPVAAEEVWIFHAPAASQTITECALVGTLQPSEIEYAFGGSAALLHVMREAAGDLGANALYAQVEGPGVGESLVDGAILARALWKDFSGPLGRTSNWDPNLISDSEVFALAIWCPQELIDEVRPRPTTIVVTPDRGTIAVGDGMVFVAETFDQFGDGVEGRVTWRVSDPDIGSVTEFGWVTGVAPGKTRVIAEFDDAIGFAEIIVPVGS